MLQPCARRQTTNEQKGASLGSSMASIMVVLVVLAVGGCSVSHSKTAKGEEVTIKTPVGAMNVDMFGMKLVVASFDTDDAPEKVADFYSKEIKKYGNVLQCKSNGMRFNARRNGGEEWGCEHGE